MSAEPSLYFLCICALSWSFRLVRQWIEKVWERHMPSFCAQEGSLASGSAMSMVSESAAVRAQASAPSLSIMPEWACRNG
eukprot:631477-Pelagomonas_calceolata.AAC.1